MGEFFSHSRGPAVLHTHARNFTRLGGRARNHPPTHAAAPTQAPVCVRSFPRKTLGIYGHSWPPIVRGNAGVFKLSRGEKVTHEWGHAVLRGLFRTSPPWGRAARKPRTRRRERPCAQASRLPCLLRCEIRPRFMRGLNAAYAGAVFAGASCGRDSLRPAGYPLRRPLPPSEKVLPPVLGPAVPPPSRQGG